MTDDPRTAGWPLETTTDWIRESSKWRERAEIAERERDEWRAAYEGRAEHNAKLTVENRRLRDALAFYADPDTYFAIAFFPDPPCGAFMDDFDEEHGNEFYDRPMPGQRARAALAATEEPDGST